MNERRKIKGLKLLDKGETPPEDEIIINDPLLNESGHIIADFISFELLNINLRSVKSYAAFGMLSFAALLFWLGLYGIQVTERLQYQVFAGHPAVRYRRLLPRDLGRYRIRIFLQLDR